MVDTANKNVDISKKSDAPDGFDISAGRVLADGWAIKEKDNVICGRLLGRNSMNDDRAFYQIKLTHSCKALTGKGDDTISVVLQPGNVVNVDESKAMDGMRKYIQYMEHGGLYDVWIKYGEKQKLDGGNTFWPIVDGPRLKEVKKPKLPVSDTPF